MVKKVAEEKLDTSYIYMTRTYFKSAARIDKRRTYDRIRKAKRKEARVKLEKELAEQTQETSKISDLAQSLAMKV